MLLGWALDAKHHRQRPAGAHRPRRHQPARRRRHCGRQGGRGEAGGAGGGGGAAARRLYAGVGPQGRCGRRGPAAAHRGPARPVPRRRAAAAARAPAGYHARLGLYHPDDDQRPHRPGRPIWPKPAPGAPPRRRQPGLYPGRRQPAHHRRARRRVHARARGRYRAPAADRNGRHAARGPAPARRPRRPTPTRSRWGRRASACTPPPTPGYPKPSIKEFTDLRPGIIKVL